MKSYTAAAKAFYKSRAWENTRCAYAKSVGWLCERCLAAGLYVPGKIVHHRVHLDDDGLRDPKIALSFDNLELLCQDCHNKEHMARQKRYVIDAAGGVHPRPVKR